MTEQTKVNIPAALYAELQTYLADSIFSSMDDLAVYILQDFLERQSKEKNSSTEEGQKVIEDRLKNLGYL